MPSLAVGVLRPLLGEGAGPCARPGASSAAPLLLAPAVVAREGGPVPWGVMLMKPRVGCAPAWCVAAVAMLDLELRALPASEAKRRGGGTIAITRPESLVVLLMWGGGSGVGSARAGVSHGEAARLGCGACESWGPCA